MSLSLDQRYLQFRADLREFFSRHPEVEPLNYFLFKDLLVRRQGARWAHTARRWVRHARERARGMGRYRPADVVLWLESARQEAPATLLPLHDELSGRGLESLLIASRMAASAHRATIRFRYTPALSAPSWQREAWAELTVSFPDLRDSSLARSFRESAANLTGLNCEFDRLLAQVRPKVVVVVSTQMMGGAALMVRAREHGCRTILLQHGILQAFYVPIFADRMLTWGETSSRVLQGLGVPEDRYAVAGSPRHDAMRPSGRPEARSLLCSALGLPVRPTVVFFSNGNDLDRNGSAPAESAAWLEQTGRRFAGAVNVVVRLHPNEDGSLYHGCRHLHVTKERPDLITVLDGADAVASLCSTVLYEGLLFRKPVLQFYADGWPELADNWRVGLAQRIASAAELDDVIERLLRDGIEIQDQQHLVPGVFANHGHATQAVADIIEGALINA